LSFRPVLAMVDYQDQELFPAPRDRVWTLLKAHLDDAKIPQIHSLIRSQVTVSHSGDEWTFDRTIDARGKLLKSRWKLTYRPPGFGRWEVVSGEGPWAEGSYIESTYAEAPEGTLIKSHGDLKIKVLPFFMPQKSTIERVLGDIESEDRSYIRG